MLTLEGVELALSVFRRFGDGSSGEEGVVGEEAAARCINFIVNSREDIDFGALPGVLAADILRKLNPTAIESGRAGSCAPFISFCPVREQDINAESAFAWMLIRAKCLSLSHPAHGSQCRLSQHLPQASSNQTTSFLVAPEAN